MKNKIISILLILALIIVLCIVLTGCGKKEEENTNNVVEDNEREVLEDESDLAYEEMDLSSDDSKYVLNYGEEYKVTFYHDSKKITGAEVCIKYTFSDDETKDEVIERAKKEMKEDEEYGKYIESFEIKGEYVIAKLKSEAYAETTLEDLKTTYEMMEKLKNGDYSSFIEE